MVTATACPSCGEPVDLQAKSCEHCDYPLNREATMPRSVKAFERPRIQLPVTLVKAIDSTGSSRCFADGVTRSSKLILEGVQAKVDHLKVYVQTHGDEDYREFPTLITNAGSPEKALEDIKRIVYSGGGDAKETHLSAFEKALDSVPWESDPMKGRGVFVGFVTDDSKRAKSGRTAREIGERFREKGILFYLVCQPTKQFKELVAAAGGLMFEIRNDPKPEEMQEIATLISASIAATVGTGGTIPMQPGGAHGGGQTSNA